MRDGKMQWKGRVLRVNSDNKGMQLLFGKKVVFRKWILVVSVVSRLVAILFSVQNVRGGVIVVLMCLDR